MVSVNTASAAALRSLQSTSKAMVQAQTRISTGLKVNEASDDPIAWAAASQLRGTIKSNEVYSTKLTSALSQTKLTTNALAQVDKSIRAIRTKVDEWSAGDATTKASVLTQISNLQKDMADAVKSAKYNGANWLESAANVVVASGVDMSITVTIADQINGASAGLLGSVSYGTGGTAGAADQSLMNFSTNALTNDLTDLKAGLDAAITKIATAQTNFSAAQDALETRQSFLKDTNDILSNQVSSLVDADLDEESAKLSALQVRQQLATTALSIINQSQLNILRLFQ